MKRNLKIGIGTAVVLAALAAVPWKLTRPTASDSSPARPDPVDAVVLTSATSREGPLKSPPPIEEGPSPAELIESIRTIVSDSVKPAVAAPEVDDMIALASQTLERADLTGARINGGSRAVDWKKHDCLLIEIHAQHPPGHDGDSIRFIKLEGGEDDSATAFFDGRFEPFEAGGYYIREAEGPGERAAITNTSDSTKEAIVWQVERIVIEAAGVDESTARKIDQAAEAAGLYSGKIEKGEPKPDQPKDEPLPSTKVTDAKQSESVPVMPEENGSKSEDAKTPEESPPIETQEAPPAPKPQPDFTISGHGANVTSVRFFEGGPGGLPTDQRRYSVNFNSPETRYVFYELNLAHEPPNRRHDFTITNRWLREDGSLLNETSLNTHVAPGWVDSNHASGYGGEAPGNWVPGIYRVELLVGGNVIGKGSIAVQSPALFRNIQVEHDTFDAQNRKGILINFQLEVTGCQGQEVMAGVSFEFQDGTPLRDADGQYVNLDGFVSHGMKLIPAHETTVWKEPRIFFPIDQLHLAKGEHKLKMQLWVYHLGQKKFLTRSNWIKFNANQN